MLYIDGLRKCRVLDKGKSGTILRHGIASVIKVAPLANHFIGTMSSPHYQINAENKIMKLFSGIEHVIEMTNSYIVDGTLNESNKATQSMVFHIKRVKYGNLKNYIQNVGDINENNIDVFFRSIVFQVAFALQTIYEVYPNFRHNDLSLNNILVEHEYNQCKTTQYVWNNIIFEIPNVGCKIRICDFGLSCINGIVDNYELIRLRMSHLALSIGYEKNQKADLFRFVSAFYHLFWDFLDDETNNVLSNLFNGHLKKGYKENSFYAPNNIMKDLPTVSQVLLCKELWPQISFNVKFKQYKQIETNKNVLAKKYFKSFMHNRTKISFKHVETIILAQNINSQTLINNVYLKTNNFLKKYPMPTKYTILVIILSFIDIHKANANGVVGHQYNDICDWIRACKLKNITPLKFAEFALNWSWLDQKI